MHAQNVESVLESIKLAHHSLVEAAEICVVMSDDQFFKLTIDYLKEHEKEIEKIIDSIDHESQESALKAWTRHYSGDPETEVAKIFKKKPLEKAEQFVDLFFESKRKLIDIYDSCISGLSNPAAQELFERLRKYEQSQLANFGRRVSEWQQDY